MVRRADIVFRVLFALFAVFPAVGVVARENVLHLARMADPVSLEPSIANTTEDAILVFLVHLPLIDLVGGTNLIPRAAQSWEVTPDAKRLTFRLREGLRFSNGRPVTAEDYRFHLERLVAPRTASWQQGYLGAVKGYDDLVKGRTQFLAGLSAPATDTLVIELSRPDPSLLFFLPLIAFATSREVVEAPGADPGRRPVGCGPYRLREWRRGVRLVFERNPYMAEVPDRRFERIELEVGGDETTHLMRFERGELGIANILGNGIPMSDLARLGRHPKWGPLIEVIPGMNLSYITLNTEIPPLNDRRIRQALNYAVDRPRRMLTRLRQFVPATGILPSTLPGHDPTVRGYSYDPEKARALLAESGFPLPLRTTLWHPNDQRNRMVAEGLQEDLERVGVLAELRAVGLPELADMAGRRGRVAMSLWVYNVWPDPRDMIETVFDGRNLKDPEVFNVMFYNNPEVNHLVDLAAASPSNPERYGLFRQAERILLEDAPCVFLGSANSFLLRQPWLKGHILEPFGFYRLDRAWREL